MGFHPDVLEPKHLVAISESDVVELIEALGGLPGVASHDSYEFVSGGGPALRKMLIDLPQLYNPEGASFSDNLSERGKQALERMVRGVKIEPLAVQHRAGATVELIEALNEALKEDEIAEAHFTISLYEGHPGPERSAIVERREKARAALSDAALAYGKAVMAHQEKDARQRAEEAGADLVARGHLKAVE